MGVITRWVTRPRVAFFTRYETLPSRRTRRRASEKARVHGPRPPLAFGLGGCGREGSRSRVGCANDRPCESTRYLLYEIALALEPPTVVEAGFRSGGGRTCVPSSSMAARSELPA